MNPDILRDLILNADRPIVLKDIEISWKFIKDPLSHWLQQAHECIPDPSFDVASQKHGDSPQFERFREIKENLNFGNFLDFSSSEEQKEHWTSYSYKSLKELRGVTGTEAIDLSFCGFPEINEEITLWLGSAGAHTSCHYDTYGRNVVVQVHGRKRWILFSPDTPNLHPSRVPFEESSVYSSRTFFSPKNPQEYQDIADFAYVVDLNPGDVLIVPPQWWHYVEALEDSLSFNAWIPIDQDRIHRIDEFLVMFQLSKIIPPDLSEEKRKLLLNPNSLEEFDEINLSEGLLEVLLKDALDEDDHHSTKKARREYKTNYLTEDQLQTIIQDNSGQIQIITKSSDRFLEILRQNSSRFCPKTEETVTSDWKESKLTMLVSLIHALCAPSSIETARMALINSYRSLLDSFC